MTPLETVLEVADGARKSGTGWSARCPAHEDKRASLSITESTGGKVLLFDHAGCPFASIVKAWGLEEGDLFPPKDSSGKRIVAEYAYTDEAGTELFQAVRFEPKDFRQRHRVNGSAWKWNLNGTRRVPYRLPELLAGVKAGATAYVVEGEKDVEAIRSLGLVATCNPMGAGKWRNEYAEWLRGARVVVIADKDEPDKKTGRRAGQDHATAVEASLRGKAASVCVVEVPEGKDASDWIAAGATREDFEKLASGAAPELETFTATDLLLLKMPTARFVCAGLVIEGLSILAGRPKIGKSWLALQLAIAVALGRLFLGRVTERCGVLYLALEDGKRRLQGRLKRLLGNEACPENLHFATSIPRVGNGFIEYLAAFLVAHPDVHLVVLDTLARVRNAGKKNGDRYQEDSDFAGALQRFAMDRGLALVCVTHTRKASVEDFVDSVNATLGLSGGADGILVLERSRLSAEATLKVVGRDFDEAELGVAFSKESCSWSYLGPASQVVMSAERRAILDTLRAATGALTPAELALAIGKTPAAMSRLLFAMKKDGQVEPGPRYGTWMACVYV